ncbi:bifunctional WXG100 family type VII secretion target/C40 family peptidase [Microtetraspora niveoalba]|uniref:bifunctional WXG100 family type VII secretion target/C40 family peptidase n=1 Tax=Microtetraspora niveoalba TaxID=46175 RepID=UPI000830CEF9|nr:C40 family peptidase [Microtetraspora niveoalba]
MADQWDIYLQPIQRVIDTLIVDEAGISAITARLRNAADDVVTYTDTLNRAVGTVNNAWNGEAADRFAEFMAKYPNAAANLSAALTSCATQLESARTALNTSRAEAKVIYDEKRAWIDEQRQNSSTISMTYLRIQVDDGVTRAEASKQQAVNTLKQVTAKLNETAGVAFFSAIGLPTDQDFVPGNKPNMRWLPDPAFQPVGATQVASYDGAPPGADPGSQPGGQGAGNGSGGGSGSGGSGGSGGYSGYGSVTPPPNARSLAKNPRAQSVIDYALKQLGDRYVWGATGPDSFDCSGLTLRAYQAAGITVPRVAAAQWSQGPRIPDGSEQAGDLIFFDNNGDGSPDHVGIVLDPEKHTMIHAPNSRSVVRIESYAAYSTPRVGFTRPGMP